MDNRREERNSFRNSVTLPSFQCWINISYASMFFSIHCLFLAFSKRTTPPRETMKKWKICLWNSSSSYWMSFSLKSTGASFSQSTVWRWQLKAQTNISVFVHMCVQIVLYVCVFCRRMGFATAVSLRLGEFGGGGGGCSWGLCGGPLSYGATGA